jgi:hypothetical protein
MKRNYKNNSKDYKNWLSDNYFLSTTGEEFNNASNEFGLSSSTYIDHDATYYNEFLAELGIIKGVEQ